MQKTDNSAEKPTQPTVCTYYLEPKWPLFLKVLSLQNKVKSPIKTRGPIWVLDIYGRFQK